MKPKETEEDVTKLFKEAAAKILQTDYKHLKSGRTYTVSTVALREADLEPLVVYRNPDTGVVFCRPLTEFQERFEERPQGVYNRRGTRCQSAQDGECFWKECPQLRDGEPERSGRHCPLDIRDDNARAITQGTLAICTVSPETRAQGPVTLQMAGCLG